MNFTKTEQLYPRMERIVMGVILVNSAVIFIQAYGVESQWLTLIDIICTLIFVGEMALKMRVEGFLGYWRSNWNRLDGTLVLLSLPSIWFSFMHMTDLSFLLIFRMLRAFRFFRVIHFFPGVEQLGRNFRKAMSESMSLFVGYFIIIIIFSLLSTSLFGHAAPQYFGNPTESIYSVFRLFTIEGWYEIPNVLSKEFGPWGVLFTRLYFVFLLVLGGVIGLSLINSVFVDAMVSDNNDDLLERIDQLEEKIDRLLKQQELQEPEDMQ
ncbi:MAG: ion transporter [Bacteroidaceae bacterium]|nr:ion transporter [Bacteroidaceae bacterium]